MPALRGGHPPFSGTSGRSAVWSISSAMDDEKQQEDERRRHDGADRRDAAEVLPDPALGCRRVDTRDRPFGSVPDRHPVCSERDGDAAPAPAPVADDEIERTGNRLRLQAGLAPGFARKAVGHVSKVNGCLPARGPFEAGVIDLEAGVSDAAPRLSRPFEFAVDE